MAGRSLNISFFGSSLVSAYWNGAATYYRGLIKALYERGHRVTFYEPDAFDRQKHRDITDPYYAKSIVYDAFSEKQVQNALRSAEGADVLIKTSGVGVFDSFLEEEILNLKSSRSLVVFLDVDAPATLERMKNDPDDKFRQLVPEYDLILTYGGGAPVITEYESFGARQCVPVYNALDPATHFRVAAYEKYICRLSLLANRMPDREERVWEYFLKPALSMHEYRFILGGNGWQHNTPAIPNVKFTGHIYTEDHNAFNSSPLAVLNISRDSMARYGFSPATRIFEAAGAGACIITDWWEGIDFFLEPGREILVAENGSDVEELIRELSPVRAREIGEAAMARVLKEHTYKHRASLMEKVIYNLTETSGAARL